MWPDEEFGEEHPPDELLDLFLLLDETGMTPEEIGDFQAVLEAIDGLDG